MVFKKDLDKDFPLVLFHTMGGADFNQFMQLKILLATTAEDFGREENLSPVLIPTMSKDMDELRKLAHKMNDVVDRANRKPFVTQQQKNVKKRESSHAQVRLFAREQRKRFFNKLFM